LLAQPSYRARINRLYNQYKAASREYKRKIAKIIVFSKIYNLRAKGVCGAAGSLSAGRLQKSDFMLLCYSFAEYFVEVL